MNRFGSQLSQNCSQKLPDQLTTKCIHLIFIFSPNNRNGHVATTDPVVMNKLHFSPSAKMMNNRNQA